MLNKICTECESISTKNECCGIKTLTKLQLKKQAEYCEEHMDWKTSKNMQTLLSKFEQQDK